MTKRFLTQPYQLFFVTLYLVTFSSAMAQDVQFNWAKGMGGVGNDGSRAISTDAVGNVYTIGYFAGTVDFDPGTGSFNLTSNFQDIFISKLDVNGNFVWAKGISSTSSIIGHSIIVDVAGNVYITGDFAGTVDFDPGTGSFNLTAVGSSDIFVSKLDANGNFVWAKSMGGIDEDYPRSLAVDVDGNVYTTGYFYGTADFDPGADESNLTAVGYFDIFISKLDANGNFVWAKRMGGVSWDQGSSISTDAAGNIYITGLFQGTVDFDPGISVVNLTSAGESDIFISKLDKDGNFIWAKNWGGVDMDAGSSIAVDAASNVYTTGYFYGTVDFDPGINVFNLISAGSNDIFISKLDANGNFVWAKRMGGVSWDSGSSIAVDAESNVYTTGYFNNTTDFDPGTDVFNLTSAGSNDIFVSKLDANGNFVCAKRMGGAGNENSNSIAVDAKGNVYTTGLFSGTADFDPGTNEFNLTSAGENDIFISKLSLETVLPVTLLSFSAEAARTNLVKLSWATVQELNAAYFAIERSRDASNFTETAQVAAKGGAYATTIYNHLEESPLRGQSYYRLRQVDQDGSYRYSKIVTVRTTGTDTPYPNPIKNNVIRIEAREGSLLKLADLNGREVSFATKRINEYLLELQPIQQLVPGIYVISVNGMGHQVLVE